MPVLDMPIDIDKKSVLRYLGYRREKESCLRIEEEIKKVIREAEELITARICYDHFNFIFEEENNRIVFSQGVFFTEEDIANKLKDGDHLVIAIMTLGEGIDNKITELFSGSDYLKGMIYNSIGSSGLDSLRNSFRAILEKQLRGSNRGITAGFSPGNGCWDISDQRVIFELLDAKSIGVVLNDSMMMSPEKSLSVVYGVGKDFCQDDPDSDCSKCNSRNCQFRLSSENMTS